MAKQDKHQNILISEMKTMLAQSIGRAPTGMVVLVLVSVVVAVLSGLAMKMMMPEKTGHQFMPLRLEADANAPQINTKKISGTWIYQTPVYAMSFSFFGDRFEWLIQFGDIPDTQFYARGNYRIDGNVLILGVRPDLGKPYDPKKPWIKYMPIAMRDLNVNIAQNVNGLTWVVPVSEQKNIISHTARIFENNTDGNFLWVSRNARIARG